MSHTARQSRLLGLLEESDVDEISDSLIGSNTASSNKIPKMASKTTGRGRTQAGKVTKPAQNPTRRGKGRPAAALSDAAARDALAERSTNEEVKTAGRRGRKPAQVIEEDSDMDDEVEKSTKAPVSKPTTGRPRGRPKRAAPDAEPDLPQVQKTRRRHTEEDVSEIPETQQPDAMEMDEDRDHGQEPAVASPEQPTSISTRRAREESMSPSKQNFGMPKADASTAQLRRRIGELTGKCESLETKYRDLREIGIKEAERSFDRYKKANEEKTEAANALIAGLRDDLTAQRNLAKEGRKWKESLEDSESKVADLSNSLAEARKEITALTAKLAASRSAEGTNVKVPGSAMKGSNAAVKGMAANTEAVRAAAQMREDLYGDLTGLIIRGAKRDDTGDVYDCIQTGRNGTLHFKLVVEHDESGDNYEDAQFSYKPQLDEDRDRDLMDMMPDYLLDEISFPRPHAAKFFARVSRSLME